MLRTLTKHLLIAALTLLVSGVASAALIGAQLGSQRGSTLGARPPEAGLETLLNRETILAAARFSPP